MDKLVLTNKVENKILQIRGRKVILDTDIARLYGVPTKRLNEQVKRNISRFPPDFMFQLTVREKKEVVAICDHLKILKYSSRLPHAFTEQGVSMLSSVLNSERAIMVNIQIMRAFVGLRRVALTYVGLKRKIDEIEKKYDGQFAVVFEAIRKLLEPSPGPPKRRIGFKAD